jgi:hypothetical protein
VQPTPTVTLAPPVPEATPETLIFRAGLLTPDQLGELVQERVSSGRTVQEIVVDRGWADAATVARVLGLEPPAAEVATPVVEVVPPVTEIAPTVAEFAAPVAEIAAPAVEATPPVEPTTPVAEAATPAEVTAPVVELPLPSEHTTPAETAAPAETVAPAAVSEPASLHVVAAPVADASTEPAEAEATELEFRAILRFAGNEVTEIARFESAAEAKEAAHAIAAELAGARDAWPFLGGRYVRPEAVLSVDVDAIVR